MGKILICHLSDIHIMTEDDVILKRVDKIGDLIKTKCENKSDCIFLISGDISFSGKEEQYSIATQMLNKLKSIIEENGIKVHFITVPGNHDCLISDGDSIREMIFESLQGDPVGTNVKHDQLCHCLSANLNYNKFASYYNSGVFETTLNTTQVFEFDGVNILFNLINTAWMSLITQKPDTICMPEKFFNNSVDFQKYNYVFTVFHHPYSWINEISLDWFQKYIEKSSDIVFTGHKHRIDDYRLEKHEVNYEVICGGFLQEHHEPKKSYFNLISIDLKNRIREYNEIKYVTEQDTYIIEVTNEKPINKNKSLEKYNYQLSEEFSRFLKELGLYIYKGPKDILVDDIFVYPDLRNNSENSTITRGNDILNLIIKEKILVIAGEEFTGKTTLAKKIFKDLCNMSFIPIFISGSEINSIEEKRMEYLIKYSFCKQYKEQLYDNYVTLVKDKKVLIIDDFQQSSLNSLAINELLSYFNSKFAHTILICNEYYRINRFMDKNTVIDFCKIPTYSIMEFNCRKRDELIEKWVTLGQEYVIELEDINKQCIDKGELIDRIIGEKWIPSYPNYILIILQQLEMGNKIDNKMSTHGYLYQSLINMQIAKISNIQNRADVFNQVLITIAQFMYTENAYQLSELGLHEVIKYYNELYKMEIDAITIDELIKGKLLSRRNGYFIFRHKYIYYYYLALYLSNNLANPQIKNEVLSLCSKLYSERNANILVFLTHFTKDKEIIDEIIYSAIEIFYGTDCYDFVNHKSFISGINVGITKILLPQTPINENRKRLLEQRAILERSIADNVDEASFTIESNQEELYPKEIMLFNKALKTLDILGQILKNYPGSLTGVIKIDLITECHDLAMRTLNVFLILTNKAVEEGIIDDLISKPETIENIETNVKIEIVDKYKKMFVLLAEAISFSFIRKVASSIGDETLKPAYLEVFRKYNNIVSFKLLEIAVYLFNQNRLPEDEIIELSKELKNSNNFFTHNILRRLVGLYLYLYGCKDFRIQQRICKELNISHKKVLIEQRKKQS